MREREGHQTPYKLLLVEDNALDAKLIQEMLAGKLAQFQVKLESQAFDAMQVLKRERMDIILLDLMLPDCVGLETYMKISSCAPETPIVVLTAIEDEELAIEAVSQGAQDYLVKSQISQSQLARSLRFALERQKVLQELRSQSFLDELTGLYNRRGFLTLAEQQIKLARRAKRSLVLIFADLDGLKQINDTYGHREGDRALQAAADLLKKTFRSTDILARIGGDEFTVLALEAGGSTAHLLSSRLQQAAKAHNAKKHHPYQLSLSLGWATYDPHSKASLEDLMVQADRSLYKEKKRR